MKKKPEFTIHERRVLGLPFDEKKKAGTLKEMWALKNIIDTFPWMLEVADRGYDKGVAQSVLSRELMIVNCSIYLEQFDAKRKQGK